MYSVIRKYEFAIPSTREIDDRIKSEFVPLIEKIPGFIQYLFISPGDGTLTSISVFDSKVGTDESTKLAAEFAKKQFPNIQIRLLETYEGEVKGHTESTSFPVVGRRAGAEKRPSARH